MDESVQEQDTIITAVNKNIGLSIRKRRVSKGLSSRQLGERIGVSAESIRQYEEGNHSIAAGKLLAIAETLETPVEDFFAAEHPIFASTMEQRKILAMMQGFLQISSPRLRESIGSIIRTVAEELKSLQSAQNNGD